MQAGGGDVLAFLFIYDNEVALAAYIYPNVQVEFKSHGVYGEKLPIGLFLNT